MYVLLDKPHTAFQWQPYLYPSDKQEKGKDISSLPTPRRPCTTGSPTVVSPDYDAIAEIHFDIEDLDEIHMHEVDSIEVLVETTLQYQQQQHCLEKQLAFLDFAAAAAVVGAADIAAAGTNAFIAALEAKGEIPPCARSNT
ncbi:uncharacterized protein EMH_0021510 [Eimeria mitis]|uniref:Uncharacterized protein n=1 Tax=Eimeria mitis TaxID=44415 RepID=U6KF89_9EIME|nr:uncharacterized protein EMH_0021510 [Eimeria mitis]CDJ36619.1 hypothetical protein EMH_0021510 [Eimeria mitis]